MDNDAKRTEIWFDLRAWGYSPAAIVSMTDLQASYTPRFWLKMDGIHPQLLPYRLGDPDLG